MKIQGQTEQKTPTSLFRKEVLQQRLGSSLGKVIVVAPISFTVWSVGSSLIAIVLILFLCLGEYTRRQEVHGILIPNKGLIDIYAEKPGVIIDKFVQQGEEVRKGQLLYLVSTEQHNLTGQSLYIQQKASLEKQIKMQKERVDVFNKNVDRYKCLFEKKLISETEYQKHNDAFLSASVTLHDLEYRLNQVEGNMEYAIRAPEDGVVSVLTGNIGDQITERYDMLGSIIPKGAKLQGFLYVPNEAIGFIKAGQKVLLKYQAFPYQQFGLYESTIESIDRSILSAQDIKTIINLNTPFYRVIVNIEQQHIVAYGSNYLLVPGMQFEAIILTESRKLWQWVLAPIYSFRGSLRS